MENENPKTEVTKQETSGSASPLEKNEILQKVMSDLARQNISIEEIYQATIKAKEEKIKNLRNHLEDINNQIKQLMQKKQEILQEITEISGSKIRSARTGVSRTGMSETINIRYALDGIEMSASAIARELNLTKASAVNWKRVFLSVLNGNSGGLTAEEQEEIRSRVSIIQ